MVNFANRSKKNLTDIGYSNYHIQYLTAKFSKTTYTSNNDWLNKFTRLLLPEVYL